MASNRDPNASFAEQRDQVAGAAQSKADGTSVGDMDRDDARREAEQRKNQLLDKIPDEHREKINNAVDSTKQVFQDAFPEERREQFIYRLKKVRRAERLVGLYTDLPSSWSTARSTRTTRRP